MLETVGREADDFLRLEDIETFPCEDLRILDQLWVKYSEGRFGFSVQSHILNRLGLTKMYDKEIWRKFCEKLGWLINGEYKTSDEIDFAVGEEKGHLPTTHIRCLELYVLPDLSTASLFLYRYLKNLAQRCVDCNIKAFQTDIGAIDSGGSDWLDRHDYYIGQSAMDDHHQSSTN